MNRKEYPMARGLLDYFPDALMEVANVSHVGNEQHNPGQPMHWAKDKSTDHADCIMRHLKDRGTLDTDKLRHSAKVAWRALAMLQIEIENQQDDEPGGLMAIDPSWIQHNETPTANGIGGGNYEAHSYAIKENDTKPVKTVYISGPMRGKPDLNFPAFDKVAYHLRQKGFTVISPADTDRTDMVKRTNRDYARRDLDAIFDCSHIAMLPGWESSVGALAEFALARWLGLVILNAETGRLLRAAKCDALGRSVNEFLEKQ